MSANLSNVGSSQPRNVAVGLREMHGGPAALIMHIRSEPAARISAGDLDRGERLTHPIDDLLESSSLRTVVCPDVYRGLARLLKPELQIPDVVFIRMDELGRPELEFFSIVSRLRPSVPVYVYGHSEARNAEAIHHGASGPAEEETIRKLEAAAVPADVAGKPPEPRPAGTVPGERPGLRVSVSDDARVAPVKPITAVRPKTEQPATVQPTTGQPTPEELRSEQPAMPPAEAEPAAAEPPGFEQTPTDPGPLRSSDRDETPPAVASPLSPDERAAEGSEDAARVPWLRYEGRPTRTAPQRRPPTSEQTKQSDRPSSGTDSPTGRTGSPEPLLTEEELRALMGGDDIASIGPEQRKAPPVEEPDRGSGES